MHHPKNTLGGAYAPPTGLLSLEQLGGGMGPQKIAYFSKSRYPWDMRKLVGVRLCFISESSFDTCGIQSQRIGRLYLIALVFYTHSDYIYMFILFLEYKVNSETTKIKNVVIKSKAFRRAVSLQI